MTVGTAVIGFKPKAKLPKWHCECMMVNGSMNYIAIKAADAFEASQKAQKGYPVEYVLDVLTHEQMERRKRHLKPSIVGAVQNF